MCTTETTKIEPRSRIKPIIPIRASELGIWFVGLMEMVEVFRMDLGLQLVGKQT